MSLGIVMLNISKNYEIVSFSREQEEEICRIALNDIPSKEELIKTCMDLVTKMAYWYAQENGKSFSKMVNIGKIAFIDAIKRFHNSKQLVFINYASQEILRAMLEGSKYTTP